MTTDLSDAIRTARSSICKYYGLVPGYFLLAFSFFIPLWPNVLPVLLIGSAVSMLFSYRRFHRVRRKELFHRPVLLFAIVLFAAYTLGVLWSSDYTYAREDLIIKLPMLVLPLMFFILPIQFRGKKLFVLAFIMGCVYSILLCLVLAGYRSLFEGGIWLEEFSYSQFSILLHPSYFSMYLVVALNTWFLGGFFKRIKGVSKVLIPCILMLGILMLGSKAGWIVFGLSILFMGVYFRKDREVRNMLSIILLSMVLGAIVSYATQPTMRYRVDEFLGFMKTNHSIQDPSIKSSSAVRVAIWNAGSAVFKEHPLLGTGTGDVKNELLKEYRRRGMHSAVHSRLNGHSQQLQTTLTLGLLGFVLLNALFFSSSYLAFRRKDWMMISFLGVTFVNWMVESMLEVQAGVMFFAWGVFVLSMRDQ